MRVTTHRVRRESRLLLVAALMSGVWLLAGQEPDRTFVAVMRPDGLLVPIAIRDAQVWWHRWPWADADNDAILALPVPETLDAIPDDWLPPGVHLPADWKMLRGAGPPVPVRAVRPVRQREWDLMATIALLTDLALQGDGAGSGAAGWETGVAIAGTGELGRFLDPAPDESQRVLSFLSERLRRLEVDEIARWQQERLNAEPGRSPVVLTPTTYGGTPPTGSPFTLRRAERAVEGRTYYYLTGVKLFQMDSESCAVNLSFKGVVVAGTDQTLYSENLAAWAYAEFCGDAAESLELLATLYVNSRVIWIVKISVGDGYHFELFDPETRELIRLRERWMYRR